MYFLVYSIVINSVSLMLLPVCQYFCHLAKLNLFSKKLSLFCEKRVTQIHLPFCILYFGEVTRCINQCEQCEMFQHALDEHLIFNE